MKSLDARFRLIELENPFWSSLVCFNETVKGQNFSKKSIYKWFPKLVDKDDYDGSRKTSLILRNYALYLTSLESEYELGSYRDKFMGMPEYTNWKKSILTRDHHKCVLCGSVENLQINHIKPFLYFIIKYKIKSREDARGCDKLWDLDNGETLCFECHKKSTTYGNKSTGVVLDMLFSRDEIDP